MPFYFVHSGMRSSFLVCVLFAMGCSSRQVKETPALGGDTVLIPTKVTTRVDYNDGTYFTIILQQNGFEIQFQNKVVIAKDAAAVSEFIGANRSSIDPNKIMVVSHANTPPAQFKSIVEVIKAYSYYKFQMITK